MLNKLECKDHKDETIWMSKFSLDRDTAQQILDAAQQSLSAAQQSRGANELLRQLCELQSKLLEQTGLNPPAERVLRPRQAAARVGLSIASLYRLARQKRFPQPVRIGLRASGWRESELLRWMENPAAYADATPRTD